jgi:hypothetical protein
MKRPKILRDADKIARTIFVGIAIPCELSTVDGGTIRGEKILKFNRKALKRIGKRSSVKVDPRHNGSVDTMILPVGKPGSRERVEALAEQYTAIAASGEDVSPFSWEG